MGLLRPTFEAVTARPSGDRRQPLSPAPFTTRLADRVAAGALKFGSDFNQLAATDRTGWTRRLFLTVVLFYFHHPLLGDFAIGIVSKRGGTVQA